MQYLGIYSHPKREDSLYILTHGTYPHVVQLAAALWILPQECRRAVV